MDRNELLATLRHAAGRGLHHVAALNEMRDQYHLTDKQFRAKVIQILEVVLQVDNEIDDVAEAVMHR